MHIQIFTPTFRRGNASKTNPKSKVVLFSAIRGKKRKTTAHTLSVRRLVDHFKIGWQYAQVGLTDTNDIIIFAGNEDNGYKIGKANFEISNQTLNNLILKSLGYRIPETSDDSIRVEFAAKYLPENNVYLLTVID